MHLLFSFLLWPLCIAVISILHSIFRPNHPPQPPRGPFYD